jgi:hypothetical protein
MVDKFWYRGWCRQWLVLRKTKVASEAAESWNFQHDVGEKVKKRRKMEICQNKELKSDNEGGRGAACARERNGEKTEEWVTTEHNRRNGKIKKIRMKESLRARKVF